MPFKPSLKAILLTISFSISSATLAQEHPPENEAPDYCETPDGDACTICPPPPKEKFILS